MRKFLIPAIVLGAATIAAPASAQYQYPQRHGGYGYGHNQGQNIYAQLRQLDQRINRAYQRGAISRNEARRLSQDLRRIEDRFQDYRRNGLSEREHYDLRRRIQNLREQIREDRRDGRRDGYDRRW